MLRNAAQKAAFFAAFCLSRICKKRSKNAAQNATFLLRLKTLMLRFFTPKKQHFWCIYAAFFAEFCCVFNFQKRSKTQQKTQHKCSKTRSIAVLGLVVWAACNMQKVTKSQAGKQAHQAAKATQGSSQKLRFSQTRTTKNEPFVQRSRKTQQNAAKRSKPQQNAAKRSESQKRSKTQRKTQQNVAKNEAKRSIT